MTTYNGWANYETWVTNLWFDDVFTEDAENYRDDKYEFAKYIQEYVEEQTPMEGSGLATDLLRASLGRVDWIEIAEGYLSELPALEEA